MTITCKQRRIKMARYYAESNLRSYDKVDIRKIESGEYYRQARKDVRVKKFCK